MYSLFSRLFIFNYRIVVTGTTGFPYISKFLPEVIDFGPNFTTSATGVMEAEAPGTDDIITGSEIGVSSLTSVSVVDPNFSNTTGQT